MSLKSLINRVIPTATSFVASGGNPAVAFATAVQTDRSLKQAKKQKIENEKAIAKFEEDIKMQYFDQRGGGFTNTAITPTVQTPTFFERLGNLGSSVGSTLLSGLESAVPSLLNRSIFGESRPRSASQGPALTTVTNVGAQESQGSGSIQAGAGALLPTILGGARSLLKSPAGQLALGGGSALALTGIPATGKTMRITRKMKSQYRTVLNLAGGNIQAAADILGVEDMFLINVLLKRFRNDGPVVTKAALRKTKSTIRRLHSMQDVLKSITPTAAGRRRAPMKRATTTTLIKN